MLAGYGPVHNALVHC